MTKIEKLRDLHNFLISKFRPKYPVHLRICKLKDYHGLYQWDGENKIHYITLEKRDNLEESITNLIHEFAHLLQKYKNQDEDEHSDEWGINVARIYRKYMEWLEQE